MGPPLLALLLSAAVAAEAPPAAAAAQVPAAPPLAAGAPGPAPGADVLAELVQRARRRRLAEDPAWLRLGHWRRTAKGGFESEVDGPAFFRSLFGKTDPRAELEATLRGLFDARPVADELSDAQCRFPARFAFLAEALGIDAAHLPRRACPRRDDFLARVGARSATLVFSSYYVNNPVSSFGHTLLRLNKAEEARGAAAELLDYGINYSATLDGSTGLLYALKGLFGFFKGEFNHYGYYYKVREYADAESRDLWEYDLALDDREVARLAAHLWELGGTWFDYWYLDENCSYHVLGALEAAAPRLELLSHVGQLVVLPSDTVKALFRNPGLVRAVRYRPSIRSQFEARLAALDAPARGALTRLGDDPAAPLPDSLSEAARAAVLDAAIDRIDLRFFRKIEVGAAPEAARARQVLLERRSRITAPVTPPEVPVPLAAAPHLGHGSFRLGVGGGTSSLDGGLVLLDLRLALHDLGDPPVGYPSLSQLEFLPVRVRLAPRDGDVALDEAWALRIVSLNDLSRFDLRPSWRVRFGGATVRDDGCDGCLAAQVEVGAGASKANLLGVLDLYAGVDASLEWSPRLAGIEDGPLRAGVGPGALARLRAGSRAALLADARWRWLPGADPERGHDLRAALRLHLSPALSLAVEARRTPSEDTLGAVLLAYY